jgi:hypothetical protein
LRGLAKLLDESAKRHPAITLVLPGELGDVQHVGQCLLPSRSQNEADMRARVIDQRCDRVGHGAVIALGMQ